MLPSYGFLEITGVEILGELSLHQYGSNPVRDFDTHPPTVTSFPEMFFVDHSVVPKIGWCYTYSGTTTLLKQNLYCIRGLLG